MFSRRNLFQDIITHWFGIVLCILFKGRGVPILSQWKFANTWILCKNLLEPAKRTTFAASNWLPGTMDTTLSCPFWYPLDTCEKTRFIACAPNPVPHGIQDQNKILCGPVSAWIHESLKITPKNYVLSYLVPVGLNCYRVDFTKRNRKRCQQICFTPRCCEASIFLWANGSWNNVCEYVFLKAMDCEFHWGPRIFFFALDILREYDVLFISPTYFSGSWAKSFRLGHRFPHDVDCSRWDWISHSIRELLRGHCSSTGLVLVSAGRACIIFRE